MNTVAREIKELFQYHIKNNDRFAQHDYNNVFLKTIRDLKHVGFGNIQGSRMLDLGCGQRYPMALLFASEGADTTALDINYVKPDAIPAFFLNVFMQNGLKRALKSVVRRILFDKSYYAAIERCAGKPVYDYRNKIQFLIGKPEEPNYPVPSDSFNLVISNAVIEHVEDIDKFVSEIARILVPGGYFYGIIHNYYSLSGGHNLDWAYPDEKPSKRVPPWDHLRGNLFPTHVYVSHYKPQEYKAVFEKYMSIELFENRDANHDSNEKEGAKILTSSLADELSQYPRELLLTRSWCIICKKKSVA